MFSLGGGSVEFCHLAPPGSPGNVSFLKVVVMVGKGPQHTNHKKNWDDQEMIRDHLSLGLSLKNSKVVSPKLGIHKNKTIKKHL